MWFLRLAKSLHKLFRTQFLFGTKIKSTYENILQNTKILDLSVKRGFLVVCHLLLNFQKNLWRPFSVLAKYGPFWLWTWSKIENFHSHNETWIIFLFPITFLFLILALNRNCVRKSLCSDLASLTNHIS